MKADKVIVEQKEKQIETQSKYKLFMEAPGMLTEQWSSFPTSDVVWLSFICSWYDRARKA
jgi:hypothetical protein